MKQKHSFLKNNRGLAIEMAVSFMLVTFALCAILLTVAFNTTTRNKRVYNATNDYFTLDQLGEYFVRALETDTTVKFTKDISDEDGEIYKDDPSKVRGGWFKYVNGEGSTSTEFALNMSGSNGGDSVKNGVYTLRVSYWENVPTNGKVKDEDLLLIVSVQKEGRKYKVVNWSNQLLDVNGTIKDNDPAEDVTFLEWIIKLLQDLWNAIKDLGRTFITEFNRIIDIIF